MAKKRGPDGKPVDVPTHVPPERADDDQAAAAPGKFRGDEATDPPARPQAGMAPEPPTAPPGTPARRDQGRNRNGPGSSAGLFEGTDDVGEPDSPQHGSPGSNANADERTVIHRGQRARAAAPDDGSRRPPAAASQDQADAMADPIAGWLVVVDGPGMGRVLHVGHGQNGIGRAATQRITLDFGDAEISGHHATITFDPRGNRFFIQPGSGSNLAYLGDEPVLAPTPIDTHTEILLGQTRLRFVAFCGPEFSWQDR